MDEMKKRYSKHYQHLDTTMLDKCSKTQISMIKLYGFIDASEKNAIDVKVDKVYFVGAIVRSLYVRPETSLKTRNHLIRI
ncbi:hypothetical protein T4D_1260 [Trichinella pseudospiralis]|uniref:Uncharacterized protein n=1 Tax=Trichinella pseudospiralis TaxID=6337 RepID=A0A0V1FSY5_TRIPS|nr:hypothetical protein T4D_1260 [Trichinella pseudospiralis]